MALYLITRHSIPAHCIAAAVMVTDTTQVYMKLPVGCSLCNRSAVYPHAGFLHHICSKKTGAWEWLGLDGMHVALCDQLGKNKICIAQVMYIPLHELYS